MPHDDLMPRERDALEKKNPPPPRSLPQTPAPVAVAECRTCKLRHTVNEACPGCGRRVLLG
jgi:hypothetical protein